MVTKRNNRTLISFILIFWPVLSLFIFSAPGLAEQNINQSTVNFYSFQTFSEPQTKSVILINPAARGAADWELEAYLEEDLTTEDGLQVLSGSRLQTATGGEIYTLKQEPVNMEYEEIIELMIEILPTDLPGNYETELVFLHHNPGGQTREQRIQLKLKIESWLKVSALPDFHLISELDSEDNLMGKVPVTVKIEGNIPWDIYVTENQSEIPGYFANKLILLVDDYKDPDLEIVNSTIQIDGQEKIIARGQAPVFNNEQYLELVLYMKLTDFVHIPAGEFNFPVSFRVESREE